MEAEHQLKAAYPYIGATRAAFIQQISLTTAVGTASYQLSGLFDSGNGLSVLDAQRSFFVAQQALTSLCLAKLANKVRL